MTDLTPIQKEIVTALEQMKEKSLITEANLAKKVRENAKISGKNKAGICLKDLEVCKILKSALNILEKTISCFTHFILTAQMIF